MNELINVNQKKWWKETVVYQIYPKSFCDSDGDGIGDIKGIISKLDYLQWLGVGVLWLSPIYPSPGYDNGYDISDYNGIADQFGTMEDFNRLMKEAHGRNLRVILDLVVNHSSDEHAWFLESRSSKDQEKRDYYIWRDGKSGGSDLPPNNWGSLFGGSGGVWTKDEKTDQYYLHLFSEKQPDLNWENEELRKNIYKMMRGWLDLGVDGFRMDVISLISKNPMLPDGIVDESGLGDGKPYFVNGPKVHDYLQEMRREVLDSYDIMTVGEACGVTVEEAKKYASASGQELDMIFHFEVNDLDGGESFKWNNRKILLPDLKKVMNKWQVELEGTAWNSLYWCNHDQPRVVSRLGDSGKYKERSATMLATCLHGMKGTPYIYQGEEIGMTNMPFTSMSQLRDPESIMAFAHYTENGRYSKEEMMDYIRGKSRDNARTPMQWTAEAGAGFTKGTAWLGINPNHTNINVAEQRDRLDSVLNYYRNLIAIRKKYDIVVYGKYEPETEDNPNVYAYTRRLGNECLYVGCNFSSKVQKQTFLLPQKEEASTLICNVNDSHFLVDNCLEPYESIMVYYKSK
ncbi:alpha-glucosidase [Lachnospiraceae bacterium ZAX-1]